MFKMSAADRLVTDTATTPTSSASGNGLSWDFTTSGAGFYAIAWLYNPGPTITNANVGSTYYYSNSYTCPLTAI